VKQAAGRATGSQHFRLSLVKFDLHSIFLTSDPSAGRLSCRIPNCLDFYVSAPQPFLESVGTWVSMSSRIRAEYVNLFGCAVHLCATGQKHIDCSDCAEMKEN